MLDGGRFWVVLHKKNPRHEVIINDPVSCLYQTVLVDMQAGGVSIRLCFLLIRCTKAYISNIYQYPDMLAWNFICRALVEGHHGLKAFCCCHWISLKALQVPYLVEQVWHSDQILFITNILFLIIG